MALTIEEFELEEDFDPLCSDDGQDDDIEEMIIEDMGTFKVPTQEEIATPPRGRSGSQPRREDRASTRNACQEDVVCSSKSLLHVKNHSRSPFSAARSMRYN